MPLVLKLPVRIDHYAMRLDRNTFDTVDLAVCLVQVIDTIEQALSVTFSELHVGAFKSASIDLVLIQCLCETVFHLEVLLAQVSVLLLQAGELLAVVGLVRIIEKPVRAI